MAETVSAPRMVQTRRRGHGLQRLRERNEWKVVGVQAAAYR